LTLRRRLLALAGAAVGLPLASCNAPPAPVAHRSAPPRTSPLHPLEPVDEIIQPEPPTTTTEPPPTTVTTVTVAKLPPTTRGATTTVYVLPEAPAEETDEEWWAAQPGQPSGREALLACIRSYESGGDYGAVSASGVYRGAYQFDRSTLASVGGSGNPAHASPAEQDMRAGLLIDRRGLQPWPTPSRRCG
jgi:hypothetical protein